MARLRTVLGDITTLQVDVIVNAANPSLMGGGGVDGAIHRAAGPQLADTCALFGGCEPGEVRLTPGYFLPARYVVHAVGPIWSGGGQGEDAVLESCYRRALEAVYDLRVRTMAFPSISTGIYGFPIERAAPIAVAAVREHVATTPLEEVIFCCFSQRDLDVYASLLDDATDDQAAGPSA